MYSISGVCLLCIHSRETDRERERKSNVLTPNLFNHPVLLDLTSGIPDQPKNWLARLGKPAGRKCQCEIETQVLGSWSR